MKQQQFIRNEIWMLTYNAAFQRANVYKDHENENDKKNMRRSLRHFINNEILQEYNAVVNDEKHIANIHKVISKSKEFSNILNNGEFSFGVAQKMLNLYLKYYWCLGNLSCTPPHFPIDRQIQIELKIGNIISWTTELNEIEYMRIINFARAKLAEYKIENIAELELELFERRGEKE